MASGVARRLTAGRQPLVSPNGKWIAYLHGDGVERQLWAISLDGRTNRRLTSEPLGLESWFLSFAWAPDSTRISYIYAPPTRSSVTSVQTPGDPAESSVVVYGSKVDAPESTEVRLVELEDGISRTLYSFDGKLSALSWFPDGKQLLVYAFRQGSAYREAQDSSEIRAISVVTGEARTLVVGGGEAMHASVSPDGTQIALFLARDSVRYPDMYEIALIPSSGLSGPRSLTEKIFADPRRGPLWSSRGDGLFYTMKVGAFSQLFFVTTTGRARQLTATSAEHSNPTLSPDGRLLMWTEESALGLKQLTLGQADARQTRLLLSLTPELDGFVLSPTEEVRWVSRDGLVLSGLLVRPSKTLASGKVARPLIVDLHGGPLGGCSLGGGILLLGSLERQMWAARGYVVFAPDYRSSGAYGWHHIATGRENQDFMERDFDDIMTGVDHLIDLGIVDPRHMVVGGHSYGGILTNWIITHTQRFKAAVSYEGVGQWYVTYGSAYNVGGNTSVEWLLKGKPWDVPQNYFRSSPLFQMNGVATPTLFVVGDGTEYGGTYPADYEFMYTALKQQGVDTEMLRYRGEGHVLSQPANIRDLATRIVAWFEKHAHPSSTKTLVHESKAQ